MSTVKSGSGSLARYGLAVQIMLRIRAVSHEQVSQDRVFASLVLADGLASPLFVDEGCSFGEWADESVSPTVVLAHRIGSSRG